MRRFHAVAGTSVFVVLAPGVVAGAIPWWLTGWDAGPRLAFEPVWQTVAIILISAGSAVLLHAIVRFVVEGAGTPAPMGPTDHLVVGGLYRYVRNPMYVAVTAVILGQALLLNRPVLLLYGLAAWTVNAAFVRWYEEPALSRRFGAEYDAYRTSVPAWLPRLRPWAPSVEGEGTAGDGG
ncbi:isoprenylcysteine carboxylmethyltransferase family protein [Spirillospora sp. NPDC048819]|uniref:methyltransferase family protein n=1 Tax=Spirillospora sp. NPDC048819 TaxID=3155268 RepID=UPI0033D4698C